MRNGYFQLVGRNNSLGLMLRVPEEGGEPIQIKEIEEYLNGLNIPYDKTLLTKAIAANRSLIIKLRDGECPAIPEGYQLRVSENGMEAYARFLPPSETAKRMTLDDFMKDLRFRRITHGIQTAALAEHFNGRGLFCQDILIAKGTEPIQGHDAQIVYCFQTDLQNRPLKREDGSVDYFKMTTINQCRKGEVLAKIIPEDMGQDGTDIFGSPLKPRTVKKEVLSFGRNITLSADKNSITSDVDGHVSLVDGKVFVSTVYQVKSVDVATGDLEYDGDILIEGDVIANFTVKSGGNVTINGVVEGANIIADGDIMIAKGMNGMGKGKLTAKGNVIVKFLENVDVQAGGYVQSEAIMNCNVSAKGEILVEGKKGLISSGHIQSGCKITAKTIGANLGGNTILEVGVEPEVKNRYISLQKLVAEEGKAIHDAEQVIVTFSEKMKKGARFNEIQIQEMKKLAIETEEKKDAVESAQAEMTVLMEKMATVKQAEVIVTGEIFPGVTIIIGEDSKTIQTSYRYCRFVRERGEIRMSAM